MGALAELGRCERAAILPAGAVLQPAVHSAWCLVAPPRLFHEIINGLLELRSAPTVTSLDKHQWAELQAHLEEAAAADAAAAATAAAELQRQGDAASADAQQAAEAAAALVKTGSFGLPGLPGGAQHRRGAAHRRTGSIAANLRVGHIPAGSTDAGARSPRLLPCFVARAVGVYLFTYQLGHPACSSAQPCCLLLRALQSRSRDVPAIVSSPLPAHFLSCPAPCVRSGLHPQRHAVSLHRRHAHRSGGRLPAGRAPHRLW